MQFGNIIFQNGLLTTIGFALSANAGCAEEGDYCVKYKDGQLHNILVFEVLIMTSAILAVAGYHRGKFLYDQERDQHEMESRLLGDDHLL